MNERRADTNPQYFDPPTADAGTTLTQVEALEQRASAKENPGGGDAMNAAFVRQRSSQAGLAWFGTGMVLLLSFFVLVMVTDAIFTVLRLNAVHPVLGVGAALFLALALIFLSLAVIREWRAGGKLRQSMAKAQTTRAEIATGRQDNRTAERITRQVRGLASNRKHPCHQELQSALAALAEHDGAGHSAETQLRLVELRLLKPLDQAAAQCIRKAFVQSTWMSIVSPFAILDAGLSLYRSLVLTRQLALIYGGVPTSLASSLLIRRTFQAMLVAGTIEAGDTLLTNLFGGGLLAKLSAKLGEGLVSGLMTARLGLSAQRLLRPAPFVALKEPSLAEIAPDVIESFATETNSR